MISVGPYDDWAIQYGYTFEKDLKPILARVAEPELVYATDEDTFGPDPLATRYDFAANPLDYANNQMALVRNSAASCSRNSSRTATRGPAPVAATS